MHLCSLNLRLICGERWNGQPPDAAESAADEDGRRHGGEGFGRSEHCGEQEHVSWRQECTASKWATTRNSSSDFAWID